MSGSSRSREGQQNRSLWGPGQGLEDPEGPSKEVKSGSDLGLHRPSRALRIRISSIQDRDVLGRPPFSSNISISRIPDPACMVLVPCVPSSLSSAPSPLYSTACVHAVPLPWHDVPPICPVWFFLLIRSLLNGTFLRHAVSSPSTQSNPFSLLSLRFIFLCPLIHSVQKRPLRGWDPAIP